MRITFLGTAASEGFPNAFCHCENCEGARALGGPSLRKRSSALINNDLLIDIGPDLMAAAQQHGLSLAHIHYCLQTHEHEDHLDPAHFVSRSAYCGVHGTPRLHYYASLGALEKAAAELVPELPPAGFLDPAVGDGLNLSLHPIEPFQQFTVGPYEVFSVKAAHAPQLTAMLYVIEQAGRVLFYATDTGELSEETWQALRAYGKRFHVVALDHTFGFQHRVHGHMNYEQFLEQVTRLRAEGLLADDARIYAHHLAHHSHPPHPAVVTFAEQHGYTVAYDGLTVDV